VRASSLVALCFVCFCRPASCEPFTGPPQGYSMVAEDDCGNLDAMGHVVRGKPYVLQIGQATVSLPERDIIFDDHSCLLKYEKLNPQAQYLVDVVYVTEATGVREQTLEADGFTVHGVLRLPAGTPGRFIFDLPQQAYADDAAVELSFTIASGANAVVSIVRLWSTDPTRLPTKGSLWVPNGPVEQDWTRQDRLRGRPRFTDWEDPKREIAEQVVPCIDEQLDRGRGLLDHVAGTGAGGLDQVRDELTRAAERRDALLQSGSVAPAEWLEVYRAARWAVRRIAFRSPLLPEGGLLFVRRHHPHAMHQCARRLGPFTLPGGEICILRGISADGQPSVTSITAGHFRSGTFSRPDISFDGKRIVFGFAPERDAANAHLGYGDVTEGTAPVFAEHRAGPCEPFEVWEMGLDGEAPRQLTQGPAENSDPLYLPDGRIGFMSHRAGGLVQCGDWALAYCLYSMEPDGSDVRKLTMSKDGEWDPFLLNDGTIGFTRWEYVMKFWSPIQMVWSVRPDGSNPRLIYGSDLSRQYAYPLNYAAARQIPGTSKVVCIGSAHHNTGAGPVCVVDLAIGPNEASALERVTPVRYVETSDQQPDNGWYDCPYPLDERTFLVSYSLDISETETTGYGIYLLDAYGGRELIYRDPELSALFPTPLGPRPVPAPVPKVSDATLGDSGEYLVQDLHAGLPAEMRGLARYLQIVECHERHIHTSPYAIEVGPDSGFETKTVLGTVPVQEDGSAYFRVPADKSVLFSVLDKDYRALHTMRSVTNVQPGERTGCVGCHEGFRRAPATRALAATRTAAVDVEPPPWGLQRMDFAALLQPLLDRNCVRCHGGAEARKEAPDFTARENRPFMGMPLPGSYYTLRQYVKHAPIFQYFLAPGSFGSRVSPVTSMLLSGHHDVELSSADWRLLCAWIDCNAPGIGDYEIAARGKRDQRDRQAIIDKRRGGPDRRRLLAEALPAGQRLAAYLDCGPAAEDVQPEGVCIRELTGSPYAFGAAADVTAPWYDDITFEARKVSYEVSGLRRGVEYLLGFSWWDFDNGGREQAVIGAGADGTTVPLLAKTRLPAWNGLGEKPAEMTVPIPAGLTGSGQVTVVFTNETAKANAVVSEVWVVEVVR